MVIAVPMMGRTNRGSAGSDLGGDIAYDYRRRVGAYVRDKRLAAGLTQEELGRLLGMGHSAVSSFELGRSTISPERYVDLASVLNEDEYELGKFLLRYTNPWLHAMIFSRDDPTLLHDLAALPSRLGVHKDHTGECPHADPTLSGQGTGGAGAARTASERRAIRPRYG